VEEVEEEVMLEMEHQEDQESLLLEHLVVLD
jgi:hypothetical protein